MYSGIRTAHPIIDASSSTTLPEVLRIGWSEQTSCLVKRRPKIHGVDNAPSPRIIDMGGCGLLPPPLPPSTPPTPLNILPGLSSIITMTFGKIPTASALIPYGKGTASSGNRTPDSWAKGQHVVSELWLSLGSL